MNKYQLTGYIQNIQTQTGFKDDGEQWVKYSFTLASLVGKNPNNIQCYTWHRNLGSTLIAGQYVELTSYIPVMSTYMGKDGKQKSYLSLQVNEISDINSSVTQTQEAVVKAMESTPFDTQSAVSQIEESINDDALDWIENYSNQPPKKRTWTFLANDKEEIKLFVDRIKAAGHEPQATFKSVNGTKLVQVSLKAKEDIINSYNVIYNVYKEKALSENQPQPEETIKDAFGNEYSKDEIANTIQKVNQDIQSKLVTDEIEIDLGTHKISVDKNGDVKANVIKK